MKILLSLLFLTFTLSCSTMHIVKDCVKVEQENTWVCKNLKPWE